MKVNHRRKNKNHDNERHNPWDDPAYHENSGHRLAAKGRMRGKRLQSRRERAQRVQQMLQTLKEIDHSL